MLPPFSGTRCVLHRDKPAGPYNCSAVTRAVSLSYFVSQSLSSVLLQFSVSLTYSVFLIRCMTSLQLPMCFIGPGKLLWRRPSNVKEGCMDGGGRSHIANTSSRNVRHSPLSLSLLTFVCLSLSLSLCRGIFPFFSCSPVSRCPWFWHAPCLFRPLIRRLVIDVWSQCFSLEVRGCGFDSR